MLSVVTVTMEKNLIAAMHSSETYLIFLAQCMQFNLLEVDVIEFIILVGDVGLVVVVIEILHSSENSLSVPGTVQLNFAVMIIIMGFVNN